MKRTRRQALGQHFLHHQPTIGKIIGAFTSNLPRETTQVIVEIGPGDGALTTSLQNFSKVTGLPLILVERDRSLEEGLRSKLESPEIHFMDAATDELEKLILTLQTSSEKKTSVISNLPYSAASQILARLAHVSESINLMVVMVQKEVAERMLAKAGSPHRGAFSIFMETWFDLEKCFDVSPGAFHPPPKVMSTVLILRPNKKLPLKPGSKEALKFEKFCMGLFSQRRKMIRRILHNATPALDFAKLNLSGTERPEVLTLAKLWELFSSIA